MPVKPVPDGYHTVTPYLIVNDAARAIEFYKKAHGADFQQTITSMPLDHVSVETASAGTEVAIKVEQRVREGIQVHRIMP